MEDQAKRSDRKKLRLILLIACAVIAAAAAVLLTLHLLRSWGQDEVSDPAPQSSAPAPTAPPLPENPIDFASLREQYPDIVGWIRIPGTVIDYEIMRSGEGMEEDYYLSHAPDKSYRRCGSIYMQTRNQGDFSDPNTVLYGHYMANGSMFADLHKFRRQPFFGEHEVMYIYIPGHILTYRLYSAFVYNSRLILGSFDFSVPEEYEEFLGQTLDPATTQKQVREGVALTAADRIVTLSTCTTHDDERYLVVGVLTDDQPTQ